MSELYTVKCPFCYEKIQSVLGKSSCEFCKQEINVVEIVKDGITFYETVEGLKINWITDPIWDIEDTEGFQAYHDELLSWRSERELKRIAEREKNKKERAEYIREQTGIDDAEIAASLHTWKEIENSVTSQDRYIGNIGSVADQVMVELMQAQVRATLMLGTQVKRVADELKEMRLHGLIVGQA
jgi:hypothetical protein